MQVLAVGPHPPPVHGAAVVTAAVCNEWASLAELSTVDTAVSTSARLRYHAARFVRHAEAAMRMLLVRLRHGEERRCLYVTCPGGAAIVYMLPLVVLARILGYRTVVHHHSFAYITRASSLMSGLVRAAGKDTLHIVLCPEMGARFDRQYGNAISSTVCSNAGWIPLRPHLGVREPAARGLRIGHLGTLSPAKGFEEVAELASRLIRDGLNVELWLAGASPTIADKARLESAAGAIGRDRCNVFGVLEGAAKERFFDDIDVFVLPSRYKHEAEPLVVFEALQAGVPVVAYGVGCIGSQLGDCGLLVDPEGRLATDAAGYVRRLGEDRDFYEAESQAAIEKFALARRRALVDARAFMETLLTP